MKVSSESRHKARISKKIPARLSCEVGRVVVAYSNLEHQFTALIAIIIGLHKPEARLALQRPPVFDSLDIVQDLLALKGLHPDFDFVGFRAELKEINTWRNNIAHGIWLRHPDNGKYYLQITRGKWKKQQSFEPEVRRTVFPEAVHMDPAACAKITNRIKAAIARAISLGLWIDKMQRASPDKFRQRGPLVDPLGRRKPPKPPAQRGPSRG